jgi:CheY-like chemotaxis protein
MPRILIVDDDKDYRECLQTYLEFEGYQALPAADGVEALYRLRRSRPDLVLLDMMMPLMSGAQFLARQQSDPSLSRIPVLVISASDDAAREAQGLGAAGVFRKPVDFDQLAAAIRERVGPDAPTPATDASPLPEITIHGLPKEEAAVLKERVLALLGGQSRARHVTLRRGPAGGGVHLTLQGSDLDRHAVCYAGPREDLLSAVCDCLARLIEGEPSDR